MKTKLKMEANTTTGLTDEQIRGLSAPKLNEALTKFCHSYRTRVLNYLQTEDDERIDYIDRDDLLDQLFENGSTVETYESENSPWMQFRVTVKRKKRYGKDMGTVTADGDYWMEALFRAYLLAVNRPLNNEVHLEEEAANG